MRKFLWSLNHERCRECGTTTIPHKAKGLCIKCHNKQTEKSNSSTNRVRGVASGHLTKDFLIKEYVEGGQSLGDIAKRANCSRQYVYKCLKEFGIQWRSKGYA